MKVKDFDNVISDTPVIVAVFEATKVPSWASDYVNKGDILFESPIAGCGTLTVQRTRSNVGLSASHVKFLYYASIDMRNFANITLERVDL